ncbi:hypothetical protein CW304_01460 [Bacillus sp. UFRGS-B20]|nr:hypothetical protein CW304_01460 [Bacillus sp. UFRGS-B20]
MSNNHSASYPPSTSPRICLNPKRIYRHKKGIATTIGNRKPFLNSKSLHKRLVSSAISSTSLFSSRYKKSTIIFNLQKFLRTECPMYTSIFHSRQSACFILDPAYNCPNCQNLPSCLSPLFFTTPFAANTGAILQPFICLELLLVLYGP